MNVNTPMVEREANKSSENQAEIRAEKKTTVDTQWAGVFLIDILGSIDSPNKTPKYRKISTQSEDERVSNSTSEEKNTNENNKFITLHFILR